MRAWGVLHAFAIDRAWMPFVRDVRCLPFVEAR